MNAVIYARFSSDRQTEASIDAQVRACTEYADRHNMLVTKIYKDEAVSGTTANRAAYQEMLSDAFGGGFDVILIHKYDRVARSLTEQVNLSNKLKSLNIKLIAVAQDYGEGKDANLTKGIQWVLGEYYSANLSEETKKGHKETALKGLHNGGLPPFGYDVVDQKYVINEREAYYVRKMFDACITKTTYKDIIEELDAAGIRGKRGRKIEYPQVYEILKNEKYTGTYLYTLNEEENRNTRRLKPNAIRIENAFPAIIDKKTFEEARNIMLSRKRAGHPKHRCSGLVYCSCGSRMHYVWSTNKKGSYAYFRCPKKCGEAGVRVDKLDAMVDEYLNLIFSEKNIEDVERAVLSLSKYNKERHREFDKKKKEDIAKRKAELEEIVNALMSGKFKGNYEYCDELLTEKRKALEEAENRKLDDISESKIRTWLDSIVKSDYSPKAFIDRIEIKGTEVKIISTFTSVAGINGCGGTVNIIPRILLGHISYV